MASHEVDAVITWGTGHEPQPNVLVLDRVPRKHWEDAAKMFLREHIKAHGHKLAFIIPEETVPELEPVRAIIHSHFAQCAIDEITVVSKAPLFADNFCRVLKHSTIRMATALDAPMRTCPVFVVAAGPNLDEVGPLLPRCKETGTVIAVNTAVQACLHYECVPDLVVCVESADVSDHMAGYMGQQVVDLTAADINVVTVDPWYIANNEPCLAPYMLMLGGPPVQFNGSVACATAALALQWGANPIVLVGQSLGYPDGRVYGAHTPFGDLRATMDGNRMSFSGTATHMGEVEGVWVPGWRGGECLTTHNLLHFARWFEGMANGTTVINTEGGTRIDGSLEVPLETVLDSITNRRRPKIPAPPVADAAPVIEHLKAKARQHLGAGHTIQPNDMPILGLYVIPATILAKRDGLTGADFCEAVNLAVDTGCQRILEILE